MLESNSCKEYKEKHPNASDSQISLYGTATATETNLQQNWLERVTKEATFNRTKM
jgi:hypothetical protein